MREVRSVRTWAEVSHLPSFHPLLPKMAQLLSGLAESGSMAPCPISVFDASTVPPVSIQDFLIRLCKHAHCSPQVWLCMVANADKMITKANLFFTPLNVHRIVLASFVLTAKCMDDFSYGNKWYADVAGLNVQELNVLETTFLSSIDWNVLVSKQEHEQYLDMVDDADSEDSDSEAGITIEANSRCGSSVTIVSSPGFTRTPMVASRNYYPNVGPP
eukprot:Hpha_TRINITY_DN14530_c1_g4::TRINITY_DN14530_c1_g4_i1::g.46739::m.46739